MSSKIKKSYDRLWHAALWGTMWKYNISANLVSAIERLCDKVMVENNTLNYRMMPLHSSMFFFLSRGEINSLEEHDGKVSTGGGTVTNLRFVDDTNHRYHTVFLSRSFLR